MITNGMMIAHLCLNAPPEFKNLFPLKTPSLKKADRRFCLVDRPFRRAMLNPFGFADIFNIE